MLNLLFVHWELEKVKLRCLQIVNLLLTYYIHASIHLCIITAGHSQSQLWETIHILPEVLYLRSLSVFDDSAANSVGHTHIRHQSHELNLFESYKIMCWLNTHNNISQTAVWLSIIAVSFCLGFKPLQSWEAWLCWEGYYYVEVYCFVRLWLVKLYLILVDTVLARKKDLM